MAGIGIVFTGQAVDAAGNPILRADLTVAARAAGFTVWAHVKPGVAMLVASRKDTVKASHAKSMGIPTITYPEFLAVLAEKSFVPTLALLSDKVPNVYEDPDAVKLSARQKLEQARAPFMGVGLVL